MKTKTIVASAVGLLGIAAMALGTSTFAANTTTTWHYGSWTKMVQNRKNIMAQLSTGDAEAFRTAVDAAFAANDYDAFVAAHTKYGVTKYPTQEEFTAKAAEKASKEKIKTALENGDYATRKTLNEGNPILEKIDTEAKFDLLVQLESYREKARAIETQLGITWSRGEWPGMGHMGKWPRGEGPMMDAPDSTTTSQ